MGNEGRSAADEEEVYLHLKEEGGGGDDDGGGGGGGGHSNSSASEWLHWDLTGARKKNDANRYNGGSTATTGGRTDETLSPPPILSALVPRPTAWLCVNSGTDDDDDTNTTTTSGGWVVCLVEGYNGASDRPPTIMMSSHAIHPMAMDRLRRTRLCSLSVVTERDGGRDDDRLDVASSSLSPTDGSAAAGRTTTSFSSWGKVCTFDELGMEQEFTYPREEDSDDDDEAGDRRRKGERPRRRRRPPAVKSSPVHMHCRLAKEIELPYSSKNEDGGEGRDDHQHSDDDVDDDDDDYGGGTMLLLQIETFVIKKTVLTAKSHVDGDSSAATTTRGNPDVRRIRAKIEAELLQPLGSLGYGRFGVLDGIYHMLRPIPLRRGTTGKKMLTDAPVDKPKKLGNTTTTMTCTGGGGEEAEEEEFATAIEGHDGAETARMQDEWETANLVKIPPISHATGDYPHDVTYTYARESHCVLGYNPMKQIVAPRVIGWISTYGNTGSSPTCRDDDRRRVPHLAPYSFFVDVGRPGLIQGGGAGESGEDSGGRRRRKDAYHVAFAACPRAYKSTKWKDAHGDAQTSGVFGVSIVTEALAREMNWSAAELSSSESEFTLAGLHEYFARGKVTDVPLVRESPIHMECRYVKTVAVPEVKEEDSDYFLIVGEVIHLSLRKDVLTSFAPTDKSGNNENGDGDGVSAAVVDKDLARTTTVRVDVTKLRPVARLGYSQEYSVIRREL